MRKLIFIPFLFVSSICICQVDEVLHAIYTEDFNLAASKISTIPSKKPEELCILENYFQYATNGSFKKKCGVVHDKKSVFFILSEINKALYLFYEEGNGFRSYLKLKENLEYAKNELGSKFLEKLVLKEILLFFANNYSFAGSNSYEPFLQRYSEMAKSPFEKGLYLTFELRLKQRYSSNVSDEVFNITKKAQNFLESHNQDKLYGRYLSYKAYNYTKKLNRPDSALYYSRKAILHLRKKLGIHNKERLAAANLTAARALINLKEPDSALLQLRKTPLHLVNGYLLDNLLGFKYYYKWLAFEEKKQTDSVLKYKLLFYEHDYKLKIEENTQNIANFDEIYKTNELRKNNRKNLFIFIIICVLAFLVFILIYNNISRKRKIAEQQHELEIQKKEHILKEQELATIDAMILGQEKERKRLASDLHDSVGSTIAAAKLQFHHLSSNRNNKHGDIDSLYEKTAKLLDNAYSEVRNMAHVKNNGVIAKNGLLPAIKNLAKSASSADGLNIEVEDYGLEKRLDNALEISIFRIIQELVTNIIKHSSASRASISINQYDDMLNLIIEDNGNGFDARHLPKKDGMGLSSIEKRVEHLEGSMEIDSTLGKGTHILIDLPL